MRSGAVNLQAETCLRMFKLHTCGVPHPSKSRHKRRQMADSRQPEPSLSLISIELCVVRMACRLCSGYHFHSHHSIVLDPRRNLILAEKMGGRPHSRIQSLQTVPEQDRTAAALHMRMQRASTWCHSHCFQLAARKRPVSTARWSS